jgi:N-acetylmuramoyl-L-alanine amidase
MCDQPILEKILLGKVVALDVGHGWNNSALFDDGAIGNGRTEYELNSLVAKKVAEILSTLGAKVHVFDYAPDTSERLFLNQKGKKAGEVKADVFVSIHHNAYNGTAQGTETLVHSHCETHDEVLAECIHNKLMDQLKLTNRGIKSQQLGILKGCPTNIPACLTEAFFIDFVGLKNKIPEQLLDDEALGIALGIKEFLEMEMV